MLRFRRGAAGPEGKEQSGIIWARKKLDFGYKFGKIEVVAVPVEDFDGALKQRSGDGTRVDWKIGVRIAKFVTKGERILPDVEANAVAVTERVSGDKSDVRDVRDMDALKRLAHDGDLHFDLGGIGDVLIVASAAGSEIRTGRLGSGRAGMDDGLELSGGEAAFIGSDLRFDFLTRERERDENGFAVGARKTRSAIDGLFDAKLHE